MSLYCIFQDIIQNWVTTKLTSKLQIICVKHGFTFHNENKWNYELWNIWYIYKALKMTGYKTREYFSCILSTISTDNKASEYISITYSGNLLYLSYFQSVDCNLSHATSEAVVENWQALEWIIFQFIVWHKSN